MFTYTDSLGVWTSPLVRMVEPVTSTFFRVKHDKEIGKIWRAGKPEVHPLYVDMNDEHGNHFAPFQKWAQLASYNLNPWLTPDLWRKVYWGNYWISNNQGYGMEGDPRADFVNGLDVNAELPRVESLVCGGSLISGERIGDWVKVNGLHYNTPVSWEWLKDHPEYWVRGVYASGTGQPFRMLGHKFEGPPFIHPLIVNNAYGCYIGAWKLQEWTSPMPPDPLRIYL